MYKQDIMFIYKWDNKNKIRCTNVSPVAGTSSTINHQLHFQSREALHGLHWYNHIITVHSHIAKLLLYIYRCYIQYFHYNINFMLGMYHETQLININVCYLQAQIISTQTYFEEFPSYNTENKTTYHTDILKRCSMEHVLTSVHHPQIHFDT